MFSRHQALKRASHQTKNTHAWSKYHSSAQVSRSHRDSDSRLSQRGIKIKPTVNQVPRAESLVVESFGAILACVAEEQVEVGGLEGVLPAMRGPLVT